jgi:hypothetical protein
MHLTIYASVSLACGLILGKLYAWLVINSVGLLSNFIDLFIDAATSIVNLIAILFNLQIWNIFSAMLKQNLWPHSCLVLRFFLIETVVHLLNSKVIYEVNAC